MNNLPNVQQPLLEMQQFQPEQEIQIAQKSPLKTAPAEKPKALRKGTSHHEGIENWSDEEFRHAVNNRF